MKHLIKLALLATIIATPVMAKDIERKIKANKTTVISSMSTFNERNCNQGPVPRVRITKAAAHGKVTIQKRASKATKGKCKGHVMKYSVVLYTPNRGFRGSDVVNVSYTYQKYLNHPGDVSYTYRYKLMVK